MNEENGSKLWKLIQEAGDYLMVLRNSLVRTSYADNFHVTTQYAKLWAPKIFEDLKK